MFETTALYPNFDVISEVNCVLPWRMLIFDFRFQLKAENIPVHSGRLVILALFFKLISTVNRIRKCFPVKITSFTG